MNCLFCRYTWIKDGQPFDWRHYDDRITQQPGRGTLVIKSPRDEDVGKHIFFLFQFFFHVVISEIAQRDRLKYFFDKSFMKACVGARGPDWSFPEPN